MSDPVFSSTIRSRADGLDERVHTKIVGNNTDPASGAVTQSQALVSAAGELHVNLPGVVSTVNSTTTPLSGGATFTGTAEETISFSALRIYAYSDVASATNGLKIQYSTDGTNWNFESLHSVDAGVAHVFTEYPQGQHYRVVYTNGASAQATMRLEVVMCREAPAGNIMTIGHNLNDNRMAQIVRAVLSAKKPNGDYVNITATAGGNLKSSIQEFDAAVLGQKTMANSVAVVLPSDQSAIPVSQSGTWNITNITGTVSLPTGAATSANQTTANTSLSSLETRVGATDETAAATDTSTSGLNGLLKRALQRLTTIITTLTDGTQKARLLDTDGNGVTSTAAGSKRPLDAILRDAAGAVYGTLTNLFHVAAVPYRPSQGANRTAKHGYLTTGTTSRVFTNGTVTVGKTLYVTTLVLPAYNTSTSSNGQISIRDGAGGAEKIPLTIQQAGLAAGLSTVALQGNSFTFPEPIPFTTSVAVDIVAGTINYSGSFHGYEE